MDYRLGYTLILEYAVSNMSVAVGFSAYLKDLGDNLFGIHLCGIAIACSDVSPAPGQSERHFQHSGAHHYDARNVGAGARRS